MAPAPTPTMTMMYFCVNSEMNMTILVGSGRSAPRPWKSCSEGGDNEKQHEDDDQHRHADDGDGVDHGALHLALELGRLLDVARQPLKHDVEHTAGLADLEHVGEQVVEDFGILPE